MNKLLEKYLKEGCGGGCGGAGGGGCGLSPIRRGGGGTCVDYQDVEDITGYNQQGSGVYSGYKTQYNPGNLPDKMFECEGEESHDEIKPEDSVPTPTAKVELPEGGGEAGEKKNVIEDYIKNLTEQNKKKGEEEIPEEEVPEEPLPEEPVETPTVQAELPAGGQAGEVPGGTPMDPGMELPGQPSEEQVPQDPEYIGRIFELKKIYSRLVSIESFLNDASDVRLLKLRSYISKTIELFQTLINNVSAYKNNIDNLIVLFYKFLLIVYTILKKYYEQENKKDKEKVKGVE